MKSFYDQAVHKATESMMESGERTLNLDDVDKVVIEESKKLEWSERRKGFFYPETMPTRKSKPKPAGKPAEK